MHPQPSNAKQHRHRHNRRVPHRAATAGNVSRESSTWQISREQLASTFAGCIHERDFGERVIAAMAALRGASRSGPVVLVATDDLGDLAAAIGEAIRRAWVL